jgi:thiamine-monophosphate kinase
MEEKSLSDIGELGVIDRIRKLAETFSPNVVIGIGDDAAVVKMGKDLLLFSTDLLIEGIHFRRDYTPPELLGKKAVAVNVSDIAAMGGVPLYFTLSFAAPEELSLSFLDRFASGISASAEMYNLSLIGGDTSAGEKIVIDIAIIGKAEGAAPITRAGASPGELIFVSGNLGDSAVGLTLLEAGFRMSEKGGITSPTSLSKEEEGLAQTLLSAHLNPQPELTLGRLLAERRIPGAMLDISDGLARDIGNLCRASKVGARLYKNKIPLSEALIHFAKKLDRDATDLAISGGEDYRLLFTAPPEKLKEIEGLSRELKRDIIELGEIVESSSEIYIMDEDGREASFSGGYDHFGKK